LLSIPEARTRIFACLGQSCDIARVKRCQQRKKSHSGHEQRDKSMFETVLMSSQAITMRFISDGLVQLLIITHVKERGEEASSLPPVNVWRQIRQADSLDGKHLKVLQLLHHAALRISHGHHRYNSPYQTVGLFSEVWPS
jgi:hypothetical protein